MGLGTRCPAGCPQEHSHPRRPAACQPRTAASQMPSGTWRRASGLTRVSARHLAVHPREREPDGSVRWSHWPVAHRCTQHLSPSRPLRKLNKSSTNAKAIRCSNGRRKSAALWEVSRPSQRPRCPVVNTSQKERTWGRRRRAALSTAQPSSRHRYRPPVTQSIPDLTQDADLQVPTPQEAWPCRRLTDVGIKRAVPWAAGRAGRRINKKQTIFPVSHPERDRKGSFN